MRGRRQNFGYTEGKLLAWKNTSAFPHSWDFSSFTVGMQPLGSWWSRQWTYSPITCWRNHLPAVTVRRAPVPKIFWHAAYTSLSGRRQNTCKPFWQCKLLVGPSLAESWRNYTDSYSLLLGDCLLGHTAIFCILARSLEHLDGLLWATEKAHWE